MKTMRANESRPAGQEMKTTMMVAALAAMLVPVSAMGQSEEPMKPWMVRFRALTMNPANGSDAFTALSTNFPSDAVHLTNKTFPEVDFSYFFTPNWALELVLTYPQRHDVILEGVGKIGSLDHLPPILSAQYHFTIPESPWKPYVGVGLNYTRITRARINVSGTDLDVDRNSFGLALGLGVDYKVGKNLYLNFDYKWVDINTDVKVLNGGKLTRAQVDPNLISVGIGFKF